MIKTFIVMCGERKKRKYLDVFVSNNTTEYTIIQGLKIVTPQASINHLEKIYNDIKKDWVLQKIQKLKTLYNL